MGFVFPDDAEGLAHVPGVGPYTAAAIASIAFDEPVAAVDGNVIRVCTRLAAVTGGGDAAKPSSDAAKAVRLCADWLINNSSRPGDFNQAMMELGATVCTPKAPACGRCPLREGCAGAALESAGSSGFKVTDLPEKEKKPEKREERVAVKVVERRPPGERRRARSESSFLLVRRPEGGLLGGLWEFPSAIETTEPSDGEDFYAKLRGRRRRVHSWRHGWRFERDGSRIEGEFRGGDAHVLARSAHVRGAARGLGNVGGRRRRTGVRLAGRAELASGDGSPRRSSRRSV